MHFYTKYKAPIFPNEEQHSKHTTGISPNFLAELSLTQGTWTSLCGEEAVTSLIWAPSNQPNCLQPNHAS